MAGTGYTVGDYLAERLTDAGVDRVFGVPGDYTLALLDYVIARPGLAWTGCANELNAGYAADGYARMRGIGALCTTFGVGELSAINAVAGSFAEHVPVVHIVGSPASGTQAAHRIVHHSLGDGVFDQFAGMYQRITCAQATLTAANATAEIDRVLAAVKSHRLPGYLLLPADVASAPAAPPTAPLPSPAEPADPDAVEGFTAAARRLLATASSPADVVVLSGLLAHRFGAASDLARLLAAGPLTHATTLWGKSLVDESDPYFAGVYTGAASDEVTRQAVEDAAVLITAGVQFTDLNSGFFTQQITRRRTIEIGAGAASVGAAVFSPISLRVAVQALTPLIADLAAQHARPAPPVSAGRPAGRSAPGGYAAEPASPVERRGPVAAAGRCGPRGPGNVVLRCGDAPAAERCDVHRPAAMGLDRLHAAGPARRLPGPAAAARDLAHRRRCGPDDRSGAVHDRAQRDLGRRHRGGQRRLHRGTRHPRPHAAL